MSTKDRTRTPIPHRDIERETCGAGAVTTYQLTPEELAEIRAKYPATKRDKAFKAPIEIKTKPPKEDESMSGRPEKEGPSCGLTREVFLEQIAKGETIASIEKAWGMKYNTLTFWVKKWELKGITPGKARELLEGGTKPVKPAPAEQPLLREKDVDTRPATELELLDKAEREINRLTASLRRSEEQAKHFKTEYGIAELERVRLLEEVERWKAKATETVALSGKASEHLQAEVERLTTENQELLIAQAEWRDLEEVLLQRIAELEAEQETEQAPVTATLIKEHDNDPVNHPAHYTAGGIECIDAIEAATAQLTGREAYSTGQVIKYVWRWRLKGGVEDLRKAQWYLQRLIGGAAE